MKRKNPTKKKNKRISFEGGGNGRRTDFYRRTEEEEGPQDDFLFVSRERIFEKGKKELKNTRFRERGRTREREKERERKREKER